MSLYYVCVCVCVFCDSFFCSVSLLLFGLLSCILNSVLSHVVQLFSQFNLLSQ